MGKGFVLFLLIASNNAAAQHRFCYSIQVEQLQSLIGTLSRRMPDAANLRYSRFCYWSGEGKNVHAEIYFQPKQLNEELAVWKSDECTSSDEGVNWQCEVPVRHRQLLYKASSIELENVDLNTARRALQAIERLDKRGISELLKVKHVSAELFRRMTTVRRIYVEQRHIYVEAGADQFIPDKILLEPIKCGLKQCALKAVSARPIAVY